MCDLGHDTDKVEQNPFWTDKEQYKVAVAGMAMVPPFNKHGKAQGKGGNGAMPKCPPGTTEKNT